MADLYGRAYRLVIGTTEIDARAGADAGLRITFNVERDEKRTPNAAEIQVYCLSRDHREALSKAETVSVALEAGYLDDVGVIFQGDLRSATIGGPPDRVVTVRGGDGENAIRTAKINRTFKAGTPVATVLREIGRAMGVSQGNLTAAASGVTGALARARTVAGVCADELEAFCRTQGLRWSIQDSALQIRTEGRPVVPGTGYLLSPSSGLIGTPEVSIERGKGKVVTFTALLRADIIPGVAVALADNEAFEGNLVVTQTTHEGDSHGGPWYVRGTGKPL